MLAQISALIRSFIPFDVCSQKDLADSVLTKPVLEASLRSMLALAAAREKTLECEVVL